jgi:hypothetical protein
MILACDDYTLTFYNVYLENNGKNDPVEMFTQHLTNSLSKCEEITERIQVSDVSLLLKIDDLRELEEQK